MIGRTGYPLEVIELEHARGGRLRRLPGRRRSRSSTASRRYGYAFVEDDRPGRFDVEAARALGVTEGPDFGRLQRGETVNGVTPEQVVGEDRPGRRIVYSGDTTPTQTTEVYAHNADVLIHEATFCEDERQRARETGHSHRRARPRSWRATPT